MNPLFVPFIPDLHKKTLQEASVIMETCATRIPVSCASWQEFTYIPIVTADVAADKDFLAVKFFVRGFGLKAVYDKPNDPVWQDSCVEVFIADADNKGYRNFEVNCIGTLLSAYQTARGVDVTRIDAEDYKKIIIETSVTNETFEEKTGIYQWEALIFIPFKILGYNLRPETIRANFYKCADGSKWPHYVSWMPIDTPKPDFHRPEFFGTLQLEPVR